MSRSHLTRPAVRVVAALASAATVGMTIYVAGTSPVGASPGRAAPGGAGTSGSPGARGAASATPVAKQRLDAAARRLAAARNNNHPEPGFGPRGGSAASGGGARLGGKTARRIAALVELRVPSTFTVYGRSAPQGKAAASRAAKRQYGTIKAAEDRLAGKIFGAVPGTTELYRTHSVMAAIAVSVDARYYGALQSLPGVAAVHPIAPKALSNSYAVPLVGAPTTWTTYGDTGQGSTIAVIDTGIDYTHANFGGPGTTGAYDTAKLGDASDADPGVYPSEKVIGGWDFVGDTYDADDPDNSTPAPDSNPLDCNGHGSHVAGTAAGQGVTSGGATYAGTYDNGTPFSTMKIGPGVAPSALLYAYKVFGCTGSTNVVADAIDRATDPNDDGDPSDHADVINMSLGADFGSPQDGDSMAANIAVDKGVTVVVASGNGGDQYDVGGSPGNAAKVLTVANSEDAYNQVDTVTVTAPVSVANDYAAERSINYTDWDTDDLAGDLRKPTSVANLDGCDSLAADSALAGKVVFLEWTAVDATRRCGSTVRADNVAAAGGLGFVFADDEEVFSAGISGNATIPGVMVAKSAGNALRAAMAANTVTIGSTTANGFRQVVAADNDKVNDSSSRGIRLAGNVKPDVTAVGTTVFSTAMGTGSDGASFTGTSMAAPMVAGTAALVRSKHPDWTPQEVKADIVNTAGQDLFTGNSHGGSTYAPNRVGAGRIQVADALDNMAVAYARDDPGAVSVSFGPLAVTDPVMTAKTVKVANKSNSPVTYALAYSAVTTVPGVSYTVTPSSLTIDPRSSKTFTVTLDIPDPTALTKPIDPTVAATVATTAGSLPRSFLADASGRVELTASGKPTLRVPVYSAPRPASTMTTPQSVTLTGGGAVQTANVPLQGTGVDSGAQTDAAVESVMTAVELQAGSGPAPFCGPLPGSVGSLPDNCLRLPEEHSADLRYVGVTSDAPAVDDPIADSQAYFAISTWGPWQTEVSKQEFDIYIDSTGDNVPDVVLFTTRLVAGEDIFVAELDDLNPLTPVDQRVLDVEPINGELGNRDLAEFDSDTLVMPVALAALPGVTQGHSRIRYGVYGFSAYSSAAIDMLGIDREGNLSRPLSFDVLRPGITVATDQSILWTDQPGTTVPLRRDVPAYNADHGLGALVIHFHNRVGEKAQPIMLRTPPQVTLSLADNTIRPGQRAAATVSVRNTVGTPTGTVRIVRAPGITLADGRLNGEGRATITLPRLGGGFYVLYAKYSGDDSYVPDDSNPVLLRVTGRP